MFSNGFRGIIDSSIPKLEARYCCDNPYSIFHFISAKEHSRQMGTRYV